MDTDLKKVDTDKVVLDTGGWWIGYWKLGYWLDTGPDTGGYWLKKWILAHVYLGILT